MNIFRKLLNWLNPGRNKSNVFTDTPGGINGMTWEQAKEWADKGYRLGRVDKPKEWRVYSMAGVYYETVIGLWKVAKYIPTVTDNMPVWYVVKEGQK